MRPTQDISTITDNITTGVLKTLRDQRDLKQMQDLYDIYIVDPQLFSIGPHFVTDRIAFNSPFRTRPSVTFGFIIDQATRNIATSDPVATGYTPPLIFPYVYAFTHDTGSVDGFFMGLYAMTPIPEGVQKYAVSWHAKGKGSVYPTQRVDEAWTSSYNQNEADYLVNDTTGNTT